MSYVYRETRQGEFLVWVVGFFWPNGDWEPESNHNDPEDAAARVNYLNGGQGGKQVVYR